MAFMDFTIDSASPTSARRLNEIRFQDSCCPRFSNRGIEIERKPGGTPYSQPAIEVEAPGAVEEQFNLGTAKWKRLVGLRVEELSLRHAG